MNDNEGSLTGISGGANGFRDEFKKHLVSVKSCDNAKTEGCWHTDGTILNLSGGLYDPPAWNLALILNDGALFVPGFYTSTCDMDYGGGFLACGYGWIDVNGWKKPNTTGKDIFPFWTQKNGIAPWGTQGDPYTNFSWYCNKSAGLGSTANGISCGTLILTNIDY